MPTEEEDEEVDGVGVVVLVVVGAVVGFEVVDVLGRLVGVVVVLVVPAAELGLWSDGSSGLEESDVGVGVPGCGDVVGLPSAAATPGVVDPAVFRSPRCRSRFAAGVFPERAASAPAAAAAAFVSCDAASALFRCPSWCRCSAPATPPLTANTLPTAAAVLTLPLALVILPGLAWLATCLPEPDMPDKAGLPQCFAS